MAKQKIQPLADRVLVKRLDEEEEQKVGGIIIPDTAKEKPQAAKIVALGAGKLDKDGKRIPFDVKVGERVFVEKYGGTDVNIGDKEYTIIREDSILGIIQK